jgi:hypothetical protein
MKPSGRDSRRLRVDQRYLDIGSIQSLRLAVERACELAAACAGRHGLILQRAEVRIPRSGRRWGSLYGEGSRTHQDEPG